MYSSPSPSPACHDFMFGSRSSARLCVPYTASCVADSSSPTAATISSVSFEPRLTAPLVATYWIGSIRPLRMPSMKVSGTRT